MIEHRDRRNNLKRLENYLEGKTLVRGKNGPAKKVFWKEKLTNGREKCRYRTGKREKNQIETILEGKG